ncbi:MULTISPECIES: (2Fe-2S)-binding protein [Kyrpidia]|uniref:BFD-like [2Fe-2S] binding domain-containing protein n=2 Tax=Kyrpidia spormannii TaxID=2055160 RepID=A0ACA8Z8J2_9BACL|nr:MULTISPECIES: (2Fe-2S)-binding protein [Kyrpidia]MCL6576422.1 (2Fe-2S)-binding protein [Kyrpidia sp.]CAB3390672.1 BFD-like [2Fe-2S] binding domain-containing protein [Kyrpidia spormannii]CAB3391588.1 (2Fe-2S)-binding protein [Kyrpidia spormannii]HHY67308.1 (2Fe-2S)-binding protein [Alicyclobacillus sp.]
MDRSDRIIVCRCEEVELREVERAVREGAGTSQEIKMMTRAGMGPCQGRVCRALLETLTQEDLETFPVLPSRLTYHKPVRPVHLGQVAERETQ